MKKAVTSERTKKDNGYDLAWLLGQPSLQAYIDFVEDMTIDGSTTCSKLVEEWRTANDYYGDLESQSKKEDVSPEIRDLLPVMRPLAAKLQADPRFTRSFNTLPCRFGMVELRKVMVGQTHIDLDHAARLKKGIAKKPSPEELFAFCQRSDTKPVPINVRRVGSRKYLFWSKSNDLRFLDPTLIDPMSVGNLALEGRVSSFLGLPVGFGSNLLNVIESDGRLLLHNGHHRAYALADLGITHAPCLIRSVSRTDELRLIAGQSAVDNASFYFRAARPPILDDFFNPKIRKILRAARSVQMIELSFEYREFQVRDFGDHD
jgi:hypothetical protein